MWIGFVTMSQMNFENYDTLYGDKCDLFGLACDYYLVQNNNKLRIMSCEDSPIHVVYYMTEKIYTIRWLYSKFKLEEEELKLD